MTLYFLQLADTPQAVAFGNGWDRPLSAVVRAASETEARIVAAHTPVGHGVGYGEFAEFMDPAIFECAVLSAEGPTELIVCDVHEG